MYSFVVGAGSGGPASGACSVRNAGEIERPPLRHDYPKQYGPDISRLRQNLSCGLSVHLEDGLECAVECFAKQTNAPLTFALRRRSQTRALWRSKRVAGQDGRSCA
jgi:hypothetical protein